jgi:dihydrofolate reductase
LSLKIIVAMAEDRVIGKDNRMPWHIPEDLAYFRERTMGQAVIMGRKTLLSIGAALPGRTNVVLTTNPEFVMDKVETASSLEAACAMYPDAFIIGGAKVFVQALPLVETLYVTHIHAAIEGDTRFPEVDFRDWDKLVHKQLLSGSGYRISLCEYTRKH